MINTLVIAPRPISFTFNGTDIIKIDEAKNVLSVADAFTRTYKDTIDDGDSQTVDAVITNAFPTLRHVYVPTTENATGVLVDDNGTPTLLVDYIKAKVLASTAFTISVTAEADSVSDSKIVISNVTCVAQ